MRHRVPLLIAVAAMLAGCSLIGDDTANGGLGNTSWTVVSIAGQPTIPDARPTMTFAPGGAVSGSGGCNQYNGSFHTDGDQITIGPVSSTLMGCEDERGRQETAFLTGLQGATTWRQGATGTWCSMGPGRSSRNPDWPKGLRAPSLRTRR